MVREFSGCFFAAPDSHPLMYRLAYPKPEDLPGTTAVLGVPKSDNYYHWLFDVLPRLRVVREALGTDRIDRYLVDHRLAFQRETLEVLGIPVSRCIQPSPTRQYRCEHMIVPSLIRGISSTSVSFLRSTFLDAAPASRAGAPDRIYLTRHNCARRRVLNKDEVAGMLADRGFAIVDPGSLSFREQVALFSRVSTIVAPHGGSLTNLVFCRPGTRVVECFSPRYVNRCYWMLSNAVGIRYAYLLGQGRGPAPGRVPLSVYEDMRIDVDALDALIRKVDEVS